MADVQEATQILGESNPAAMDSEAAPTDTSTPHEHEPASQQPAQGEVSQIQAQSHHETETEVEAEAEAPTGDKDAAAEVEEEVEVEIDAEAQGEGEGDGDGEGDGGEVEQLSEEEAKERIAAKIAEIIQAGDDNITMRTVKDELQKEFQEDVYTRFKTFIKDVVAQEIQRKEQSMQPAQHEVEVEIDTEAAQEQVESEAEIEEDDDGDDDESARKKKRSSKSKKKKKPKRKRDSEDDDVADEEKPGKRKRKRGKEAGPARPRSAFNFFAADNRKVVQSNTPEATFGMVSKLVADRWKQLPAGDKKPYEQRAKEDKIRYDKELAEFVAANPEAAEKLQKKKKSKDAPRKPRSSPRSDSAGRDGSDDEKAPKTKYDEILETIRPKRAKKSELSEEELQKRVQLFLKKMEEAALDDARALAAGEPAVHKLGMIKDVEDQVAKRGLQELFLDKGLLVQLRNWLCPQTEESRTAAFPLLPSKKIRESIYAMLETLPMSDNALEKSDRLGEVLSNLAQHPEETLQNKQRLKALLQKWYRILLGKDATANYKFLEEVERERQREIQERRAVLSNRNPISTQLTKDDPKRKRARIPEAANFDYVIRPTNDSASARERHQAGATGKKLNVMRTMKAHSSTSKSDQAHADEVSVTKI